MAWFEANKGSSDTEFDADTMTIAPDLLTEGRPCKAMNTALATWDAKAAGEARHDHMVKLVLRLVRLGEQGHEGGARAINLLRDWFMADVTVGPRARDEREAFAEFDRALRGALEEPARTPDSERRCCLGLTSEELADALTVWTPVRTLPSRDPRPAPQRGGTVRGA